MAYMPDRTPTRAIPRGDAAAVRIGLASLLLGALVVALVIVLLSPAIDGLESVSASIPTPAANRDVAPTVPPAVRRAAIRSRAGARIAAVATTVALGRIGSPYSWGAAGPDSFDCSGLVIWAFSRAGRTGLPRTTYALMEAGVEVPLKRARRGDLVFTDSAGHMGIYVGRGRMVHSPRAGRSVSVEPLSHFSVVAIRRL